MTKEFVREKTLEYYSGDTLATDVWMDKYALKNKGEFEESTPDDMHKRLSKELGRNEKKYKQTPELNNITWNNLSHFGRHLDVVDEDFIYKYLKNFKWIIPQGSIMSMLGNPYQIGSISNCFVIAPPEDSYGGIFRFDQEIAQLEKRRAGVGGSVHTLRPSGTSVTNAAGTSTGAVSFMHRFSNTTREVAQNGRRGALMLLMHCLHPEIFDFVRVKDDKTKVTGANVSSMLTNKFMKAVEDNVDFICHFPVELAEITKKSIKADELNYNKLTTIKINALDLREIQVMKIHARELYDLIVEMAWKNGEPGVAFIDTIHNYSPDGVYPQYKPVGSNPCGEQWLQAYDSCRLLALNFFSIVINPFKENAYIDYDKLYEISYIQQRLADDIVDLEIEYVQRIIDKIKTDKEGDEIKLVELRMWEKVKDTASKSRRTGCGFTALADMIAALGLKYDSDAAIEVIEKVMRKKMEGELDCNIDLAILRGTFDGWDNKLEYPNEGGSYEDIGGNDFFTMLLKEFPQQTFRMMRWGRRSVNWSTVAPTGTVSIVAILIRFANSSGGVEPQFMIYHFRNKKVTEKSGRIDYTDANGDNWMTYPVVMGGFKEWLVNAKGWLYEEVDSKIEMLSKEEMETLYKESPYFGSCANDLDYDKRIDIQAVVQKYTTNAVSSTLNLPENVDKQVVYNAYMKGWKKGLKGLTVYRDKCRDGVLVNEKKVSQHEFDYKDAVKRPKELAGELHTLTVKGVRYGVIIGTLDTKPYELFAFELPEEVKSGCGGKIIKSKKGVYHFVCDDGSLKNLQIAALRKDEQVLTRLVSGMLRHGAKPQFIMEQIDKCDLEIVSFGKAISRTLKKYVKEEDLIKRNVCPNCGSENLKVQEGCLTCMDCGNSKCG